MPYCKEFNELLADAKSFDIEKLTNAGISYEDFKYALKKNGSSDQPIINDCALEPILSKCLYSFLCDLRNPPPSFHVGLGNPGAEILIVGNELAINPLLPSPIRHLKKEGGCIDYQYYKLLFINEVILNYYIWKVKSTNSNLKLTSCCIQDPEFPSSFCHLYNKEKPFTHYWGIINKIISKSLGRQLDFRTSNKDASFFKHVFLTELNAIPSKNSHNNHNSDSIRTQFENILTSPFYSKFKRIIFSCHSYLSDNIREKGKPGWEEILVTEGYEKDLKTEAEIGIEGKIKSIYNCRSGQTKVIVTKHLNARGWEDSDFNNLASLLK